MAKANSTRRLCASVVLLLASWAHAENNVSPVVRERLLKNARPGLQQHCVDWAPVAQELWLSVEKNEGWKCLSAGRLPPRVRGQVTRGFLAACTEDLVRRLDQEIRRQNVQTDYDLPVVTSEQVLTMYMRQLLPSYKRYCQGGGPETALAPVTGPRSGEIRL